MIKAYKPEDVKYEKFEGIPNSYIAYTQPPESKHMGCCVYQVCNTKWEHHYTYDEFYIVLDGTLKCTVIEEGKTYTLNRGDIGFAEKDTKVILEAVGPMSCFCVSYPLFSDELIEAAAVGVKKEGKED